MASPHRSESFFHDGPASPSILLVPIGDGDLFDVVLGPVFTLTRSEETSLEQESPLAVEPVGDEPLLTEGGPSHVSSSPDGQPLVTGRYLAGRLPALQIHLSARDRAFSQFLDFEAASEEDRRTLHAHLEAISTVLLELESRFLGS
jgi:hypothetical protein